MMLQLTLLSCLVALTVSAPPTPAPCNGRLVSCIMDPCRFARCPGISNAVCVSNYCNGCSADFYSQGFLMSREECDGTVIAKAGDNQSLRTAPVSLFNTGAKPRPQGPPKPDPWMWMRMLGGLFQG